MSAVRRGGSARRQHGHERHAVLLVAVRAEDLPARPSIKASAFYLIELKSGRVLLEKDATRRLPPASLTKVMTALVAMEVASPEQVVQVDRRALVHRSSIKLHAGEQFLLRDLLTAMLVTSANDACEAIAWHVGGDADRFVTMMNERARTLGLKNTHFANACGFDAPWPLLDSGGFGEVDGAGAASARHFHDGSDDHAGHHQRGRRTAGPSP